MKKMNCRLGILRQEYVPVSQNVPLYATDTYKRPVLHQKETLLTYRITGVSSCTISESYMNLTQTATINIPIKNCSIYRDKVVNGIFQKGYLLLKSNLFDKEIKLFVGTDLMIDMGYNDNYQTRFVGYITEFLENNDFITIKLDDSMYKFKRSLSFKQNFPKELTHKDFPKLVIDETKSEKFNLYHLVQWLFINLKGKKDFFQDTSVLVPKMRCYDTALGKVVMKTSFTPAEIFQYYLIDLLGMKVFFRNEFVDNRREVQSSEYLVEPTLYIGWGNWHLQEYYQIAGDGTRVKRLFVENRVDTTESSVGVNPGITVISKNQYSRTLKFAYPYFQSDEDPYNPIFENNLEWYNTDKDNLRITATSFNTDDHKKYTVIYQNSLPGDHFIETKEEQETKLKNKYVGLTDEQIKEKRAQEQRIADSQTEILSGNTIQDFNEVTLNYPNLTLKELKQKILDFYKVYPSSGLRGTITVAGEPYVRQGDIVRLKINLSHIKDVPNYITDGTNNFIDYYVKSVTTTFDMKSGIRQQIELDRKVEPEPEIKQ